MTRFSLALSTLPLAACLSSASQPVGKITGPTTAKVGQVVQLDGTGSTDKNKNGPTYDWRFVSVPTGSSPGFNDPHAPAPTFAPDVVGTFVIGLVVTDGAASNSVSQTITASGTCFTVAAPPTVNQGEKATVVTVDPSCTSAQAEFQWALLLAPTGSKATVSGTTLDPGLVPDLAGSYSLGYSVKYGYGNFSLPKTLSVTALSCAPSATITTNSDLVSVGEPAYLNAALATSAPCGHAVTNAAWSLVSAPNNSASQAMLLSGGASGSAAASSSLATTLLGGVAGKYVVDLAVTDDHGVISHDEHSITMTPPVTNLAPDDSSQPVFSYAIDPTTNQPAVAYLYNRSIFFAELDATNTVWDAQVAVLPEVTTDNAATAYALTFSNQPGSQQPCIAFIDTLNAAPHPSVYLTCRKTDGKTWPTTYVPVYSDATNSADAIAATTIPATSTDSIGLLFHDTAATPELQYSLCTGTTTIACNITGSAVFHSVNAGALSNGALVVTPGNSVRVAYFDAQGVSATIGGIIIKKCAANNCTTASTSTVSDPLLATAPFAIAPGTVPAGDTNVSIVYEQGDTGALAYENCTLSPNCGTSVKPEIVLTNSTYTAPTLVLDSSGNVDALWNDTQTLDLVRGHRDVTANTWTLTPQQMSIPSAASDANFDAYAAVFLGELALARTSSGGLMAMYSTNFYDFASGFTPFPQGMRVWQRAQ